MGIKKFFINHWIILLVAVQPLLDVLAYFYSGSNASFAGYIRLIIMIFMPVLLFFTLQEKKKIVIPVLLVAFFCLLHIINCFRLGYQNFFTDIQYMLRVVQVPLFTISLCLLIDNEEKKTELLRGILFAAVLYSFFLLISFVTGTWNSTYGDGTGITGWVADYNRNANSIILIVLSIFVLYFGLRGDHKLAHVFCPGIVCLILILNGTKACYFAAFGYLLAFILFCVFETVILKKALRRDIVVICSILFVLCAAVYPISPRAKVDKSKANSVTVDASEVFHRDMEKLGYNISEMTIEEKISDPVCKEKFQYFYYQCIYHNVPQLLDDYPIERVFRAFDMTDNYKILMDTRTLKLAYAKLVFEDSDFLTRLVGFEFTNLGKYSNLDLENDWPAIFYYYGYIGFALYISFIFSFAVMIIRKISISFKKSFNMLNYTLLIIFSILMGLAQYSGAVLRRPNVSVYLCVILALIYFQCRTPELKKELLNET